MPSFLIQHRHEPDECGTAFAAWHGFQSPLRRQAALASCDRGDHAIYWMVSATTAEDALAQLPPFIATRARAVPVRPVRIP